MSETEFARIARIAQFEAGLHLPAAKSTFVLSRLQRRLRATGIADFANYLCLLDRDDAGGRAEREHLVSALTTNVTGIFREPHHFALLAAALPGILSDLPRSRQAVRIWSAGCATGEEPLSIAATCAAVLGPGWHRRIKILATDVDAEVLAAAVGTGDETCGGQALRAGLVSIGVAADSIVMGQLRRTITFMQHSVVDPLPIATPFDVIFCRNVTIYFAPDLQVRVHRRLRDCLIDGGLLMIGHSERLLAENTGMRLVGPTTYCREARQSDEAVPWI